MSFLRPNAAVAMLGRLDLDVHARRQVQPLQRIHGPRRGLLDVYEALVRVQLEVLAGILVLERTPDHRVPAVPRGQGDGAEYEGPGPLRGLHYGPCGLVYDLVVVSFELDPYFRYSHRLLHDLGDDAGPDRPPALADGEVEPLVHRYRADQLHVHHRVVPGHHHLHPFFEADLPRHVRRAEVELRAVVAEERRVPAPLLLAEDVHLGLELRVRRDRAGLGYDLPALYVVAPHSPEQGPYVVAGLGLVHGLVEHLHPGDDRLPRGAYPDDLDLGVQAYLALLHPARRHRPPPLDREDVFDRQEERPVYRPLGLGDVGVDRLHQPGDALLAQLPLVPLQRPERGADHHGVVDLVGLVEVHHDVGHPNLPGQEDVLPRLRHGAVGGRDDQDRPVHLGGARDHILDVVGVAGAVHVGVVARLGGVLLVGGRYRDAALSFLGGVVYLIEGHLAVGGVVGYALGQNLGDGGRQRRLAVVDVAYGPHVQVRLRPLELTSAHL